MSNFSTRAENRRNLARKAAGAAVELRGMRVRMRSLGQSAQGERFEDQYRAFDRVAEALTELIDELEGLGGVEIRQEDVMRR